MGSDQSSSSSSSSSSAAPLDPRAVTAQQVAAFLRGRPQHQHQQNVDLQQYSEAVERDDISGLRLVEASEAELGELLRAAGVQSSAHRKAIKKLCADFRKQTSGGGSDGILSKVLSL
jgi:hypothetical protein